MIISCVNLYWHGVCIAYMMNIEISGSWRSSITFLLMHRFSSHVFIYLKSWLPGNEKKLAFCKKLGADVCINYKTQDFVKRVKEEMGGQGIFSTIKTLLFPIFYKGAAHVFNEIGLLLIIYFKKNIKIDMLVLFFVKWLFGEKKQLTNVKWQALMLFWIRWEHPAWCETLRG
jgi:hypothetical protein